MVDTRNSQSIPRLALFWSNQSLQKALEAGQWKYGHQSQLEPRSRRPALCATRLGALVSSTGPAGRCTNVHFWCRKSYIEGKQRSPPGPTVPLTKMTAHQDDGWLQVEEYKREGKNCQSKARNSTQKRPKIRKSSSSKLELPFVEDTRHVKGSIGWKSFVRWPFAIGTKSSQIWTYLMRLSSLLPEQRF